MQSVQATDELETPVPRWRKFFRWPRYPVISLFIIGLAIFAALFPDLIRPHSATSISLAERLTPPAWVEGGLDVYLFGTDHLGRDILSRLIEGTRVTLSVAFASILAGAFIGATIGLISGYSGGWVDSLLSRLIDSIVPIPMLLVGMVLAIIHGGSATTVILSVVLVIWARFARVVRAEVLSLKHRPFVDLARTAGAPPYWIMLRHLLPNVINTVIVLMTVQIGWVILIEASLSFLGAGINPPAPSWGKMVADGRGLISTAWWVAMIPGAAIMAIVLSFNLMGDWLRDRLDPKLRQL